MKILSLFDGISIAQQGNMKIESINDDMYEQERDDNALSRLEAMASFANIKEYLMINANKLNFMLTQGDK